MELEAEAGRGRGSETKGKHTRAEIVRVFDRSRGGGGREPGVREYGRGSEWPGCSFSVQRQQWRLWVVRRELDVLWDSDGALERTVISKYRRRSPGYTEYRDDRASRLGLSESSLDSE